MAREPIFFPRDQSANILRGAFGTILRGIACLPKCSTSAACQQRGTCPYARIFEPVATEKGPSGFADPPRPFVFRAAHLDGKSFATGAKFYFDLHLFDVQVPAIAHFVQTFAKLAQEGLGRGRKRVELWEVSQLDQHSQPAMKVYGGGVLSAHDVPSLGLSLCPSPETTSRLHVRFVTPLELKSEDRFAARPEFYILASRARDRISTLRELYGEGALSLNFRAFGERARAVRMTRCDIKLTSVSRRSTRTGQVHPLGGFMGDAEYEGDLAEFVPFLQVAQWTGLGRQTVWGKGVLRLA